MRARIVNPFLDSVVNVLGMMALLDVTPGTAELKDGFVARGDISGIIGMSSGASGGSMAITFPKAVVFQVAFRMLGDEVNEINDDVIDLVGELTNMISGGAKAKFDEIGINIGMATPVVVCGESHEIHHKSSGKSIILPFGTEAGEFYVEVCFDE